MDPELKAYLDERVREIVVLVQGGFERVEETIRQTQISVDGARSDVRAIAGGVVDLDKRLESSGSQETEETRRPTRRSYEILEQRIRGLELRQDIQQGRDPIATIKERILGRPLE